MNTTRQQKLWCHIKILIWKELVKQGLENLEFLKNGFFLQFCFLPDPITFDDGPLGLILDFGMLCIFCARVLCEGLLANILIFVSSKIFVINICHKIFVM